MSAKPSTRGPGRPKGERTPTKKTPGKMKSPRKTGRKGTKRAAGDDEEQLATALNRQRGFFVAFGYTADAEREAAAFYKRSSRFIKLLTVQEILDEEYVQKM